MKFDLSKVLKDSFYKKKLSPFYILKPAPQTSAPREFISHWLETLLGDLIATQKNLNNNHGKEIVKQGHADIFWPRREDETKNYNLKDGELSQLFSFMEYGALELPWRFAVIEDPHKLSTTYLNKLLKTLEEPAANTSVIFLDHETTQFLDTIHSRAVEFTIVDESTIGKWETPPKSINTKEWLERRKELYPNVLGHKELGPMIEGFFDKGQGLGELIEKVKYIKGCDREIAGLIVEYETDRPGRYKQKEKLCHELAWFEESKTFNNAPWERVLGLLCVVDS